MNFKEAFEALKQGLRIRRQHWLGYWQIVEGKIKIFCKDGRILGFDSVDFDELFTISNILQDDWEVLNPDELPYELTSTYTFGEAIRFLKQGKRVARKGWNGKGMFLWLKPETIIQSDWCKDEKLKTLVDSNGGEILGLVTICMFTHDSTGRNAILTGWLASQSDMLSNDWIVVA